MGFRLGTPVTIDNALKMLMVKSANDMAVTVAEGVGGSIAGFADLMNANARRLGMTQSNFVNPNGLPAENHVTSARDLGILARALITEFPEYDYLWHIHSIRYGNRIMHNYNTLLDRYPGADGMKTGFICASGYQRGGLGHPQWPPADRDRARRLVRRRARAEGGAIARARLQQRRPVMAHALARHRRRAGADRRAAAQPARGNVRRPSAQAAVGG